MIDLDNFDKKQLLSVLGTPALVAFIGYAIRTVLRRKHVTVLGFLLDALSAVVMGVIVGNAISYYSLPDQVYIAVVSLSGLLGPDILAGVLILTSMFRESPSEFITKYLYAAKGVDREDLLSKKESQKMRGDAQESER